MKIRRLNEDAKRFYVDEIVSAPGGKTETERHSFATLDELKKYCKDAGLTKDDIANCGGCELKSLLDESLTQLVETEEADDENVQKLIDDGQAIFVKLKPQIKEICTEYSNSRNKDTFDPAIWGELPDEYSDDSDMLWEYYSDLKKLLADNGVHPALISAFDDYFEPAEYFKYKYLLASFKLIDVNDVKYNLNEELEKLHTKPNGEYLVKSDSGKGYTAFSRDNVAIGGIDDEDADSDDKAIAKFKRNEYSECLNERVSSSQSVLLRLDFLALVDVFGSISIESYAEILSKKYKYSIDEICGVIQDRYNHEFNKTSPETEHTEAPPSEPIENNTSKERPSKRILRRLGINEEYFDTAEYRIQKYEDDIPELMAGMHDDYMEGKLDADRYAEVLKKVYNALAECDYKHTMSEPVVEAYNPLKDRTYVIWKDHDHYNVALSNASSDVIPYLSSLKDAMDEIKVELSNEFNDYQLDSNVTDSSDSRSFIGFVSTTHGERKHFEKRRLPGFELDEATTLTEEPEKYYAAKYTAVDNSGNKTTKKICFRCDGTIEDAENEVDAVIKEPYSDLTIIGSVLKGSAEKDGFVFVESMLCEDTTDVEYDEDDLDTWPWKKRVEYEQDRDWVDSYFLDDMFSDVAEKAFAIVEAEGYTDVFTEPSTQMGQGADFYWATKDGVRYTGRHDFQDQEADFWSCCEEANSREEAIELMAKYYASNILSALKPEDEEDYDDDYSDDYNESLEKCSGIKAHKVIMGEDIDDSFEVDDFDGVEGSGGDKTEYIEFVMDEYVSESLLIDFIEKVDPITYKVGVNDQVVTVVFDPKWSEYVYTIDGKGPYSHSSYEFISRDIYDFVMSQRSEKYQYDDLVD